MCDSVSSTTLLLPYSGFGLPKSRFSRCSRVVVPRIVRNLQTCALYLDCSSSRNDGIFFISACFISNEAEKPSAKSANSLKTKVSRNSIPTGSGEYDFYGELGIKEKQKEKIDFESGKEESKRGKENGINSGSGTKVHGPGNDATASSAVNFIGFDDESDAKFVGRSKDEDLVRTEEGNDGFGSKLQELQARNGVRRGRQSMKRSNIIAKQVISIQSALSLGFVSQLWVDMASWMVLVVEVRPNMLSGEIERFFLEDVSQVGDVVLIQDESVMDNELKMVGLETLVGYNVVTPGQRSIGKVRGYTFNINTGAVESLELDSFGISIIPSRLVSTYSLLVEDVLEVLSDTVVVHEAAASRIQRLTKGFWDSKKLRNSIEELQDYSELESEPFRFDHAPSRRRSFNGQKFHKKMRESADDWELPMDYL